MIIDLDEYRAKRVAEGTWPPPELLVMDYWKKQLEAVRERARGAAKPRVEPKGTA